MHVAGHPHPTLPHIQSSGTIGIKLPWLIGLGWGCRTQIPTQTHQFKSFFAHQRLQFIVWVPVMVFWRSDVVSIRDGVFSIRLKWYIKSSRSKSLIPKRISLCTFYLQNIDTFFAQNTYENVPNALSTHGDGMWYLQGILHVVSMRCHMSNFMSWRIGRLWPICALCTSIAWVFIRIVPTTKYTEFPQL